MTGPINIFISGVGGQGVVTLAHALRRMFDSNGMRTTGSVLKGGAQRLGTVSASLRVFGNDCDNYSEHSVEIPRGRLHLMIGLEPWECLRACALFGDDTKIVVNSAEVPLLVARSRDIEIDDPIAELAKLNATLQADDYDQLAVEEFSDRRMVNYVMGRDAVRSALAQFSERDFEVSFREAVGSV